MVGGQSHEIALRVETVAMQHVEARSLPQTAETSDTTRQEFGWNKSADGATRIGQETVARSKGEGEGTEPEQSVPGPEPETARARASTTNS